MNMRTVGKDKRKLGSLIANEEIIMDGKMIYIFCVGRLGFVFAHYCMKKGNSVVFLDNDKTKQNKTILGYQCISPKEADVDVECFIASCQKTTIDSIVKQCNALGFRNVRVVDSMLCDKYKSSISDEEYVSYFFYSAMGYEADLNNPKTFNEKLQWLKLNNKQEKYTVLADKDGVKDYVANIIGKDYIVPTIGVYDSYDQIDWKCIPNKFVMKCTHDSGSTIVCNDIESFDHSIARRKMETALDIDYYLVGREYPYHNIPRKIIIERNLSVNNQRPIDYKFLCFNGVVKCLFVTTERGTKQGLKMTFFDREWNRLPFERHYPIADYPIHKPDRFDDMIHIAETLSKDMPFVRVDLYEIDGRIYFSEFTFFPGGGIEEFSPFEWDLKLGEWITIV